MPLDSRNESLPLHEPLSAYGKLLQKMIEREKQRPVKIERDDELLQATAALVAMVYLSTLITSLAMAGYTLGYDRGRAESFMAAIVEASSNEQ